MKEPDFWDFMMEGGYDLLFPDDEENSFKCSFCGRIIQDSERVEWLDKSEKKLKCPECGETLEIR